jgi:hypothetical protein
VSGEGLLGKECPWEPRGRVRATLKLLEDRERGEGETQVCSNGRAEELCRAVIEAWEHIEKLTAELEQANVRDKLASAHSLRFSNKHEIVAGKDVIIEALVSALKKVEWGGRTGQEGEYRACPCCGNVDPDDCDIGRPPCPGEPLHEPDCTLSQALELAERLGRVKK